MKIVAARLRGGVNSQRDPRRQRLAAAAVALMVAAGMFMTAGAANAAAPKALINGDTVVGSPSQEEAIATAAGFAVTVVSDATWGTYTAADFGQYDLLIAGDPSCGTLPPGLIASASVYGPVVLGLAGGRTSAGNRIVVGTDPVLHDGGDYTSPDARGTIIREGIAYAGSQPGTTGMYFDSTCAANYYGQSAETLAILTAMSAGIGPWTIDALPPCGGSVSLIASNPSFADLTTASLQGWSCSVHESFPTFPSDWSALAVATDTLSHPTCGVDPGTGLNACGEAYILIAGSSIVVNSLVISVSPLDATNPVGTSHTVTANVHAVGGTPVVAGQLVTFTVTGQNAGASGACAPVDCRSDVNGNVSFTYSDGAGAGDDTIKASFIDDAGSLQTATAQKHWVSVTVGDPATLVLSPKTAENTVGQQHCVTATVTDAGGTPTPNITVVFSVSGANSGGGSPTTDANGQAQFCYTGTTAGTDTISAFADTNTNGTQDTDEPGDTATKTYVAAAPATLVLSPKTAENTVGQEHCVTATVTDAGGTPTPNITVVFSVSGANSGGGSPTTDANGQAQFCYTGTTAGTDTISAFADTNTNGTQDTDEPGDTATKTYVLPASTPGCKVTGGGRIIATNGDAVTFGGNAQVGSTGAGVKGEEQFTDPGPATTLEVHSISIQTVVCSADKTQASIFGTATINGAGSFDFRIDVTDLGQPGRNDTYRIRLSDGYDSGEQKLIGGNITIH